MINLYAKILFFGLTCLLIIVLADSAAAAGNLDLTAEPDHIRINVFYHGAQINISAIVPDCDGTVIKIEGKSEDVMLNRKGKVALIWLNTAKVTFKNAPQVYILAASDKVANICSPQAREELGLGLDILKKRITIESEKALNGSEFDNFVKLKEHMGTYDVEIPIHLGSPGVNRQKLFTILPISSAMPPAEYIIQLYCFREGNLIARDSTQLSIEKVGLPRFLTSLSSRKPAAYGILAIVLAMMTGIIMAIIFRSRTGRTH